MKRGAKTERAKARIRLMLGIFLAVQGGILVFLWNVQVVKGHTFRENISRQSLRRVRHPGARGKIVDRKGFVLADNRPSVGIALYMEELRVPGPASRTIDHIEEILDDMAAKLDMPRTLSREEIVDHYRNQRLLPLVAWDDLDEAALARWAERIGPLHGVDLLVQSVRRYPRNDLLAQTLGYVGRAGGAGIDEEEPFDFQLPEMEGKAGLEKVFDSQLRGEPGGELIRIDVSMYKHEVEAHKPAVPGKDLTLTLDARVQWLCERILGDAVGSIVVMDPRNGELLALASHPRYNLNDMVPRISHTTWQKLIRDPRRPMVNRPVREQYPPGSVIKPFVLLAGLLSGDLSPETVYNCSGRYYPAPGAPAMHCHNRLGHGDLDLREAIERSCNVYMWKMAEETGYDPIYRLLHHLGLGEKTGVEVDEVPGLLPTDAWKRRHHGDKLRTGDIANLSIGQGFLNVTPLQMAQLTSVIATGGELHPPRLVSGFRDSETDAFTPSEPRKPPRRFDWDPEAVRAVREGMRDVVMNPRGTAFRNAHIPGLTYAGKTGTAQFGLRGNRRYRSWMIAFAPYDNPRIAAAVLVDEGRGSGIDAAPRMKLLMQGLFGGRADE